MFSIAATSSTMRDASRADTNAGSKRDAYSLIAPRICDNLMIRIVPRGCDHYGVAVGEWRTIARSPAPTPTGTSGYELVSMRLM